MEKESVTIEKKVLTDNMKIEKVYLTSVMPYDKNAKKHPESQIKGIMKSIDELGYNDPIALDEKNVIIEGHGRFEALQRLNSDGRFNRIKILRLSNLTKNQIKAYRIAHNKLNMDTGFDEVLLKEELQFLDSGGFDISSSGFTNLESAEILKEDIETEEDVIEVGAYERAKTKTSIKPGEIYLLGDHRLMCGDSIEIQQVNKLMMGEKADMVFTDPPFGNNLGYGRGQLGERKIINDENTEIIKNIPNVINEFLKDNSHCLIWIQWRTFSQLEESFKDYKLRTVVVWDKKNAGLSGGGFAEQHEWLCVFIKGHTTQNEYSGNVWSCSREYSKRENSEHPHKKPIEVLAKAINMCSDINHTILDLFGGSGSTLIACEQLKRKCFMMELDPVYCQIIIDRWEKFTSMKAIKS